MDAELSPQLYDPDSPAYTTANQIAELWKLVKINLEKDDFYKL